VIGHSVLRSSQRRGLIALLETPRTFLLITLQETPRSPTSPTSPRSPTAENGERFSISTDQRALFDVLITYHLSPF
jgi:hypothetical protein